MTSASKNPQVAGRQECRSESERSPEHLSSLLQHSEPTGRVTPRNVDKAGPGTEVLGAPSEQAQHFSDADRGQGPEEGTPRRQVGTLPGSKPNTRGASDRPLPNANPGPAGCLPGGPGRAREGLPHLQAGDKATPVERSL